MTSAHYDVVAIGDELAGAVAAALLARRGFRVLLLCSAPVERDQVGPYAVPRSPLELAGLEAPALKRIVEEVNLVQLIRRHATPNRPAWQLCLPDHRIDVGDELERELARELPEQAAAGEQALDRAREVSATLEALLQHEVTLPPEGFWDRRDLKRITAQLPEGGELPPAWISGGAAAVDLLTALPARFASDLAEPGRIAEARLADLHRRGTWSFDGGREALRALLCERVQTYSGEVRHDLRVRGLVAKRGRVVAVGVGDRDEAVGAGDVIAALPAARLVELLSERPPERLAEAAATPAPLHRYRLHLVAPLDALPDALAPFALSVLDPSSPLTGANAIALYTAAGQGAHATITVEALADDPSPAGLVRLRGALRAHVDQLLPFVDRHLAAVWSPHDGLPPEGLSAPAVAPAAMDPLWGFPGPRLLGLCGAPHATGVKGLALASRQVLPGLGLEGELACGWIAARLITLRSKRREVDKDALLVGG